MIARQFNKLITEGYTLIFDLDNTLYNEFDYLRLGYRHIAHTFTPHLVNEAYAFLVEEFVNFGRSGLFDKYINEFDLNFCVEDILTEFRQVDINGKLEFYPWFTTFLSDKDSTFKINIITNGNVKQQENKIRSLFFKKTCRINVIYANNTEPKPSVLCYKTFDDLDKSRVIYVGDSQSDLKFSSNLGIGFINISYLL